MSIVRGALMPVLSAVLLVACSSSPKIESDLGISGAPDWVNEGTQAVDNKGGRYVYGVASAPPLNDESLQMSTADNRARAEVARVVATYVDATLRDYSESTGDDAGLNIEQTIYGISQTVLNGSSVKGRWRDEQTGNLWSFVEMDLKTLDDTIETADKLSQGYKNFYKENSASNFERFVEVDE